MNATAYLLTRLAIGTSMFGHGLVRLPKLEAFSQWMVGSFEKSMLPAALVTPFSYLLPILEFTIGVLLLIGLFTRFALIVGSVLMILLIFGSSLLENWEAIPSQLIHIAFFAVLLSFLHLNTWAVDNVMVKRG
jgi:thiosulfate dehydrogenase [quinone] large subunit